MNPNYKIFPGEAKNLLERIASMNTLYAKLAGYYLNDEENTAQFILDTADGIAHGGLKNLDKKLSDEIIMFAFKHRIKNKKQGTDN